jgi:hypothetical protein
MKPFIPTRIAEIVFAIVFMYFGYLQWKYAALLGGRVPDFMPGDGKFWMYVIGAGFIAAGLSIITGFQKTLGCYLLAGVLIIFVVLINIKGFGSDPADTLKDTALAMAAIIIGNKRK